jgi:hypothetical protein
MKIALVGFLLLLPAGAAAQSIVAPEVVRFENVRVEDDIKTVTVGNAKQHYSLTCSTKADGCITPETNKKYFLVTKDTRFKMPGAKGFMTLSFVQDWTTKYNVGENIGLVAAEEFSSPALGIFLIDTTGGGYEQDIIISDGPIIYGTGLSDADRQKAWKHIFLQMSAACSKQQGMDACEVKLSKRCLPGRNYCSATIDANLVGIGGIQEPRKVVLNIATDIKDPTLQVARTICTYPEKGKIVCRDWNTGKLISADGQ